ncbi:YedE family putative selenium transporter [Sedimentibacter sp. MB31-C6]|uniref:YedE family putative selenium transporter n=1 Tax=Sedimentibacter sp. MB31-C6 TaxID=3109366 RepID=UPI002DDD81E3|nr:YedE family putative selenium transporter [Sedimentibacter sp. MB36-C1]WSI04575.1 YedE family putative selenium transporter [Sedimentibacter sp. MB36-C1]
MDNKIKEIKESVPFFESKKGIILAGGIVGAIAVLLVVLGNPKNMGFCIACFERDIAGALGLHRAEIVQYIRPEIIGLILGAFIMSVAGKEFKSKGGSSPITRFFLGIAVMIGALIFLGCPLRMVLRIAGGDLNAIVGLLGFAAGIGIGIIFLNKGFSLKRNYKTSTFDGYIMPVFSLGLLVLLIAAPAFIFFSKEGPGSQYAPIYIALAAGLIVGILAQKTRLCMVGGMRDKVMFNQNYLLLGFLAIIVVAAFGNMLTSNFKLGFTEQPVAHTDGLWNFLGMALVGWGSVLLGGCPLRQLILAGEGNSDSAVTVMGMLVGAAVCHNFSLASSGNGTTPNGQIAVIICFVFLLVISVANSSMIKKNN